MPEAEVSLRLAFWLLATGLSDGPIEIAIDGAQVQVNDIVHFEIVKFLESMGWSRPANHSLWQCTWSHAKMPHRINIHSSPGKGDVVAPLRTGQMFRAECKKGPLEKSRSSVEYVRLREALGQILTVEVVGPNDLFAIAVPHAPRFAELAARWRRAPLVRRAGIQILTVSRDGEVHGFEPAV